MLHRLLKKSSLKAIASVSLISISLLFAHESHAAILSLSPSASNVSVGNIVSISISVDSANAAINTAGATIDFPTDLLEVMSVSESPSIFSLWVQNPSFSNDTGTVTFTGGLPTPGFTGQKGLIATIVFRAKKQGTASVVITNGSVLANDGQGTDVLTAQGSATITIGASSPAEVPVVSTGGLPPLPIITSATEPSQNLWYSETSASFSWVVPSDVTSIQTLLSKESDSVPTITYDNSVSERTVNDLPDGVLYFHLRYMNLSGWGPTAVYKVQLDSTPPKNFTLDVQTEGVESVVALDAVDAMSGIDHYSIQIDNEPSVMVQDSSLPVNDEYVLPMKNPGQHSLAVVAYDKAGNHTEADTTFTSPAIMQPTIEASPVGSSCDLTSDASCAENTMRGEALNVKGQTQYPDAPITVFVQSQGKQAELYSATTSADGSYEIITGSLDIAGLTDIWSQLTFSSFVQSPISNKITIQVKDTLIVEASKSAIYGLSFILPAILMILGLIFGLYLGWHKFFGLKKRLQKEAQEAVDEVHKAMNMFKEELHRQLDALEKVKEDRDLNKKEEKIFRELRTNIENIDEFIEKKIKKIK